MRNEPFGSLVQEALEGFTAGRFQTQSEVKRFLKAQPEYLKNTSKGSIHFQGITDLLTQPVYAGFIEPRNGASRDGWPA